MDEHIIFYASVPLNKQLTIVPEYAAFCPSGQADCDSLVDYLIRDENTMPEIKQKGSHRFDAATDSSIVAHNVLTLRVLALIILVSSGVAAQSCNLLRIFRR